MNTYIKIKRKIRTKYTPLLVKISPVLASKYLYKKRTGKKLNLKCPYDFNEKINWLNIYWQHPLVAKCGDKYEMREYVKEKNCTEILPNLIGVYKKVAEIDWDSLPNKFVLKVTNGSGYNILCKNKNKLDKRKAKKRLKKWLKTNYSLKTAEMHYAKMKPKIICEEFMETKEGTSPVDYKIFCFNGHPKLILATTDRGSEVQRYMFDLNWNKINFIKSNYITEREKEEYIRKPNSLNEMISYDSILADNFPFVRIDFYDYGNRPILGEMTFTPDAGSATRYREEILLKMGEMIKLPKKISDQ